MILIQSILFFILGAATISFFMLLLAPFIWRRACQLAQQVVRMEIPLSLNEVEAEYDFARAFHAVEMCRIQQQGERAKTKEMIARLALDKAQAQICYLSPFEEEVNSLQQKIAHMHHDERLLRQKNTAQAIELEKMAQLTQKEQHARIKIKQQKLKIKTLKRQHAKLKSQLARYEQQRDWREDKKVKKESNSLLDEAEFLALRQHLKQMAAQIVADIAQTQGEDSPLFHMLKENSNHNDLTQAIASKM